MFLSSYLLFSPKTSEIIKIFSSTTGREYLQEALDDLTVIKEYVSEYKQNNPSVIHRNINNQEVMDIAYSYFMFKKTGLCERYVYAEDNEDGFVFNRSEPPFNQKTIYESYKDLDSADFMVEEEFDLFVKDWIRNSVTLFPIDKLYALGYDNNNGKFGFYKPVIYKDKGKIVYSVKEKTVQLLMALLKYADSIDLFADFEITFLDNAIKSLSTTLSIPKNSHIIFGMSYNRLNRQTSRKKTGKNELHDTRLDTTSQTLKNTQDKSLEILLRTDPKQDEYLKRVYADCKVILDARHDNLSSKEFPSNASEFVEEYTSWLIESCGVEADINGTIDTNHKVIKFIEGMFNMISNPNDIKSVNNSIRGIVSLYSMLMSIDDVVLNETLGLSFTQQEYTDSATELYDVFGIPFLSSGVAFDILYSMKNNIGITSEVNTMNEPSEDLVNFAFITARTADSINYRKSTLAGIRGGAL